jgi:hypothetical protein
LVASGVKGYFAVNGGYFATLDLSARLVTGDVAVGSGYYNEDQLAGERTPFAGFEVWSLDPVLPTGDAAAALLAQQMAAAQEGPSVSGPRSGEIPMQLGTVNGVNAGVDVRDFYAHAEFDTPYAASEHPWDIGFGFRSTGVGEDLRIAVTSDGDWLLSRGARQILADGGGALLDTDPMGRNTLDLVAVDDVGYLAVNGDYVATLDLTASDADGEVWVSSGFYQEHKRDGATTPFSAFEVWSFDAAPREVVVYSEDGVIFDLYELPGTDLFGIVSMTAVGAQTEIEIGAFAATGDEVVGIHQGVCSYLAPNPAFALNPLDPDALTSLTTLDVPFADLTTHGYSVAIRAVDDPASVIACNEIPSP